MVGRRTRRPPPITDLGAEGLKRDRDWRREWWEKAGLGFSWSGLYGAIKQVPVMLKKARKPNTGREIEWLLRQDSNAATLR
jgi:hypothetical protein